MDTSPATDPGERWDGVDAEREDAEPWLVAYTDVAERDPRHAERVDALNARPGYRLSPTCVVAADAKVVASVLEVGEHTTIASGCVIRGDVRIGSHCSLNAGAVTIGRVSIGNLVRIAGYAVLVGENHVFERDDLPIAIQGLTSQGVVVEDDVWIGAHVSVLDGVTVGAHSVVAAGAVVTKDVPPWSVVAGVPARVVQWRPRAESGEPEPRASESADSEPADLDARPGTDPATGGVDDPDRTRDAPVHRARVVDALAALDAKASSQWPDVLARCQTLHPHTAEPTYVDTPGATWGPRALNDAVEVAGAFKSAPPIASVIALVERIQAQQHPVTGLFVDPTHRPPWFDAAERGEPVAPEAALRPTHHEWDLYGVLSCGYALEVLGAAPAHPVHVVDAVGDAELLALLDGLDWTLLAWPSGSWIDAVATALAMNRRHHASPTTLDVMWRWLHDHNDASSGMWGAHLEPAPGFDVGWLMAVNGYYRLTRGSYAQFSLPVPNGEAAIDTVLAHTRRNHRFSSTLADGARRDPDDAFNGRNACNVLDIIHPLWMLGRQCPGYRNAEIREVAAAVIADASSDWVDGQGFAWQVGRDQPGLQGTEMWLSIVYLAADIVGESHGLSWQPRGVHRLEPVASLPEI